MTDPRPTSVMSLEIAAAIGRDAGLRYVYAGNLPGRVGENEDTRCPTCSCTLIERLGFRVLTCSVTARGTCPSCGTSIPGFWSPKARG